MDLNAVYDLMTAAWQAGDYAQAWGHADSLLQYLAYDGRLPTAHLDLYYIRQVHRFYNPAGPVPIPGRDALYPHFTTDQPAAP